MSNDIAKECLEKFRELYAEALSKRPELDIPSYESLQKQLDKHREILKAVACPNCNGDGAYYDSMGDVQQCQFCYERDLLITPPEDE